MVKRRNVNENYNEEAVLSMAKIIEGVEKKEEGKALYAKKRRRESLPSKWLRREERKYILY
jgi:hypothetical protein